MPRGWKKTILLSLMPFFLLVPGPSVVGLNSPVCAEQKVETEYLVIKNGTSCLVIDFVIYEVKEGKEPLAVAGAPLPPGERMVFTFPAGEYCVIMRALKDGEVVAAGVRCIRLPDPGIPDHAKATIYIEEKGICEVPVNV